MSTAVLEARKSAWLEEPGFGVYVHIPFCARRCHYCDFNTYEGQDALHAAYADALVAEIESFPSARPQATSVFFGGGTPTLLSADRLGRILAAVVGRFGLAPGAEVTIEANPETVDQAAFEALLGAGFGRFSIGVQSAVDRVLTGLGRTHTAERALGALRAARRAGVQDLNADLIFGSPWEDDAHWRASLEAVIAEAPDHVSTYALTVEDGTPLSRFVAAGRVPDVDPDVQAQRWEVACEVLAAAGYERYEVSNHARPGYASRHNLLYWSAGDYEGFGAGAHGHLAGRRYWRTRLPRDYIAALRAGRTTVAGSETLQPDERAGEALMLGLRLSSGIDLDGFARRFGTHALERRAADIEELVSAGLLVRAGGRLALAPTATLVANEVLGRLL